MTHISDHHELASRLQHMGSLPVATPSDKYEMKVLLPFVSTNRSQDMYCLLELGKCIYYHEPTSLGLQIWRSITVPEMQDTCNEYWGTNLIQKCRLWDFIISVLKHRDIEIDEDYLNEEIQESIYAAAYDILIMYGYTKDELQYLSAVPIDVFKRTTLYGKPWKRDRYQPNMGFVYDLDWLHRIANLDSGGNAERSLAAHRQSRNRIFPANAKATNYRTCKKIPSWALCK